MIGSYVTHSTPWRTWPVQISTRPGRWGRGRSAVRDAQSGLCWHGGGFMTCLEFGACELGAGRRTRRLVTFAAQAAADPDASTPQQSEGWADCRAAYRLLDQ